MTFQELGLSDNILRAITEQGYEYPMPIQEAAIPVLIGDDDNAQEHHDLIALAQTGTGKTAAYGLPIIHLLSRHGRKREGRGEALILAPTRELCLQISDDLEGFSKYCENLHILPVYGGTNIEPQIRALKRGVDIIVATPGRLIDLMKRGAADLSGIHTLILDEADEMLSMGFQEDLDAILQGIPAEHKTLLFSATMSTEIERIAKKYLTDYREIQVGSRNEGAEHVNHIYYMVRAQDKYLALKRIVDYYPRIYGIIFCRTRMETQEIADKLIQDGYNADALHGDLSQQQRDLTMQKFRQHRTQLLVATDVAARGLDVNDLTHVINYGLPDDTENYTHRSGRTGRAGKKGTSISIVHIREKSKIRTIERIIQKQFVKGTLPNGKEICQKQLYRVVDDIERVEVMEDEIAEVLPEVLRRWEWLDKEELIKRVVSREFGRFLAYYADAPEIQEVTSDQSNAKTKRGKKDTHTSHQAEEGYARLFVNVGKIDGYYAKEVIALINRATKGAKIEIGKIDSMKSFTFVEVAQEQAHDIIKAMKHGITVKGRSVVCDIADKDQESQEKRRQQRKTKNKQPKHNNSVTEKRHFTKEDWQQFFQPQNISEGSARRRPKKK